MIAGLQPTFRSPAFICSSIYGKLNPGARPET